MRGGSDGRRLGGGRKRAQSRVECVERESGVERLEKCPRLVLQPCGQADVITRFTERSPIERERKERNTGRETLRGKSKTENARGGSLGSFNSGERQRGREGRGKVGHGQSCSNFFFFLFSAEEATRKKVKGDKKQIYTGLHLNCICTAIQDFESGLWTVRIYLRINVVLILWIYLQQKVWLLWASMGALAMLDL